ncbi:MAG: hypothetical protein GC155_06930 [Alphaproteobacteria bacterium]|nr:hypothetical protein [Alphaproteobacteria bacterium]
MKSLIVAIPLLLIAAGASAQTPTVELTCDGEFTDYVRPNADVKVTGVFLRISQTSIHIAGGLREFNGDYPITKSDEATVQSDGPVFISSINRFSGEFGMIRKKANSESLAWHFAAFCKKPKALF